MKYCGTHRNAKNGKINYRYLSTLLLLNLFVPNQQNGMCKRRSPNTTQKRCNIKRELRLRIYIVAGGLSYQNIVAWYRQRLCSVQCIGINCVWYVWEPNNNSRIHKVIMQFFEISLDALPFAHGCHKLNVNQKIFRPHIYTIFNTSIPS